MVASVHDVEPEPRRGRRHNSGSISAAATARVTDMAAPTATTGGTATTASTTPTPSSVACEAAAAAATTRVVAIITVRCHCAVLRGPVVVRRGPAAAAAPRGDTPLHFSPRLGRGRAPKMIVARLGTLTVGLAVGELLLAVSAA